MNLPNAPIPSTLDISNHRIPDIFLNYNEDCDILDTIWSCYWQCHQFWCATMISASFSLIGFLWWLYHKPIWYHNLRCTNRYCFCDFFALVELDLKPWFCIKIHLNNLLHLSVSNCPLVSHLIRWMWTSENYIYLL